jgi:DNA end-binding protein Ku
LHADCGQRLRYAKHCPVHGPVDNAAIVRGYEYGPSQHVVVEPDELDQLRPAQDKALRLERFLAPAQLDPLLFAGRSLYLVPDGPAAELGYGVLRTALAQRQRWALGRMVLGGHRQVVLVRPASTTLVLHVLHYPEQVRVCPQTVWPLAAVVGQDLFRHAVGRKRRPQDFDHQRRRLAGVQPVADDEAAVIVHESDQVNPGILPF